MRWKGDKNYESIDKTPSRRSTRYGLKTSGSRGGPVLTDMHRRVEPGYGGRWECTDNVQNKRTFPAPIRSVRTNILRAGWSRNLIISTIYCPQTCERCITLAAIERHPTIRRCPGASPPHSIAWGALIRVTKQTGRTAWLL